MKILILSDTHMYDRAYHLPRRIYEWIDKVDEVWHLGDFTSEEIYEELLILSKGKMKAVVGNGDSGRIVWNNPTEHILELKEAPWYRFWLHHGHENNIGRQDIGMMANEARKRKCNVALFGHWHQPLSRKIGGVWLISPGSTAEGRQFGVLGFCVLSIQDGEIELFQYTYEEKRSNPDTLVYQENFRDPKPEQNQRRIDTDDYL